MANFYAQYPPISGGATSNPSVGSNGIAAPGSSTEIGFIDGSGNLQGVSSSQPLPITVTAGPALQAVNLTQVGGSAISEGQKAMAASLPVVIASDQSAVPVSAASLPLPTGAATAANQTTANTTLTTINTTLGTPMQNSGGSVTANAGTNLNTSLLALESGGNLAGINGKLNSLGQKAMAGSVPVVLASDQSTVPVSVTNFPSTALPAAFFSGQQTSTGTAVAIASSQAISVGVIVQAKSTNAASVYVGPSGVTTGTGFELQPGQATSMAVNNLNLVFVIAGTSGDGVCYVGS